MVLRTGPEPCSNFSDFMSRHDLISLLARGLGRCGSKRKMVDFAS
jgi:hypothetical protein